MKKIQTKRFDGKMYVRIRYGFILRYIRQWVKHYENHGYSVHMDRHEKSRFYQVWIRSGTDPESAGPIPELIPISHRIGHETIVFEGMI